MEAAPQETKEELATGARVGNYRIERLLGRGGMGHVYQAAHVITERRVALKVLRSSLASDERLVARFMREARAAGTLAHPNAIDVLDAFVDEGAPVMVMELLEGWGLDHCISANGRLALDELAHVMVPVLAAVGEAHAKGIIHRDLKPENIFLARRGDEIVPKVLDFGIAKVLGKLGPELEQLRLTSTGTMVGTPYYMAPEHLSGRSDIDHRADVWALGVVMYECLSGELPFPGENFGQVFSGVLQARPRSLRELAPGTPDDVIAIVERCLEKSPDDRPYSAAEIARVLAAHAGIAPPAIAAPAERPAGANATSTPPPMSRRATPPVALDTVPNLIAPRTTPSRLRAPENASSGIDPAIAAATTAVRVGPSAPSATAATAPTSEQTLPLAARPRRRRVVVALVAGALIVAIGSVAGWTYARARQAEELEDASRSARASRAERPPRQAAHPAAAAQAEPARTSAVLPDAGAHTAVPPSSRKRGGGAGRPASREPPATRESAQPERGLIEHL